MKALNRLSVKTYAMGTAGMVVLFLMSCRQLASFTVAPTQTPVIASEEPPLVSFTSEAGRFSVMVPLAMTVKEFTAPKTLFDNTVECPTIFFGLNSANVTVQYCDLLPEAASQMTADQILDQARNEMMRDYKAKIDSEKEEKTQDIFPSLVVSGPVDMRGLGYDGTIKARIILANNRVYLVAMRVYQENWCKCFDQVDAVVDSMYIEPAP